MQRHPCAFSSARSQRSGAAHATIGCRAASAAAPAAARAAAQRQAARSLLCSSRMHLASWDGAQQSSIALQQALVAPTSTAAGAAPRRQVVRMGNKATGGPFAPLVVVVRNIVGDKEFNKLRGKAISLHSQVIKEFCGQLGVDNKQVQGVIRLAKKNGEKLGFLA